MQYVKIWTNVLLRFAYTCSIKSMSILVIRVCQALSSRSFISSYRQNDLKVQLAVGLWGRDCTSECWAVRARIEQSSRDRNLLQRVVGNHT